MSTVDFYASLPTLKAFIDLASSQNYTDVPDDWYAIITDVTGSTDAIAAGRYKDVNFLGACSIVAVLNALHPIDIPFVFGGDGASILVPPDCLVAARDALIGLRYLAHVSFQMDLRVGVVPVRLIQQNQMLRIAKAQITTNYAQASFLGGGMTYATDLIKQDSLYRFDQLDDRPEVDLSGMECRWQEVASRHGDTLSLIVAALPIVSKTDDRVYGEVLATIATIYGSERTYNPISAAALKLNFNPKTLMTEVLARSGSTQWLGRLMYLVKILLENSLGWLMMKFGLSLGQVDWGNYQQSVALASDYQKIDDVLRMVIAGTAAQTAQLVQALEQRRTAGDLVYGVHVSDRALLTCLIFDRRDQHIHLVDAADGGYALAAKQLKSQLAALPTSQRL